MRGGGAFVQATTALGVPPPPRRAARTPQALRGIRSPLQHSPPPPTLPPPSPRVQPTIKSPRNAGRTGLFVGHAVPCPINSA